MIENYFTDNECGMIMSANAMNYGILGGCAYDTSESSYFSNDFVRNVNEITINGEGVLFRNYRSNVGCARANDKELQSVEFRHSGCRVKEDGTSMRYECYEGRPA